MLANNEVNTVSFDEDYPEIRESIRAICAKYPPAYWRKLEENNAYPEGFVAELTETGFLAALIPEEYGGIGLPLRAAAVILETIHHAGCNALVCHAQMYIMGTLLRHGTAEQRARYLPKIASGELRLQAFGVTEPTSGSDTTNLKTRAVRDGAGYRLYGQKIWTSRALQSDLMLVLARTTPLDQVQKKTDGLSVFLLNQKENIGKGLTIRPIETMVNHLTNEVFFEGVYVPEEDLVGEQDKGFRYILDGMNAERILVASECIGDARFFIDKVTQYVNERVVFGEPIGANQGVQFPIARAYIDTQCADLMNRLAAQMFDEGKPCGEQANIAKLQASEACWRAAEACMQFHGGFGFAREYDVERKWREARLFQIGPISTNLILSYVGEHVLKMPRSYGRRARSA